MEIWRSPENRKRSREKSGEALPELKRIIGLIREKWSDTHIAH